MDYCIASELLSCPAGTHCQHEPAARPCQSLRRGYSGPCLNWQRLTRERNAFLLEPINAPALAAIGNSHTGAGSRERAAVIEFIAAFPIDNVRLPTAGFGQPVSIVECQDPVF